MVQKVVWFTLISAIYFGQICHGNVVPSNDSSPVLEEIESCKIAKSSGLYTLKCDRCNPAVTVYCEMDTFDGGWTVIQQRLDGSVEFEQDWATYRAGFGTVGGSTEFWLGLEQIHRITNSGEHELAIEMKDHKGEYMYARYTEFKIEGESQKYRMSHLGEHSGTVGDSLRDSKGSKFSTYDQDNDNYEFMKCSNHLFSYTGWWYNKCGHSGLNGSYKRNDFGIGIYWFHSFRDGTYSRMMIRKK